MKYRITASREHDGVILALDQAEVLGEAYEQTYDDEDEARDLADEMQSEAPELGLAGVEYRVEPVEIALLTYSINCADTDKPTAWMSTPGIVRMTPGEQDSGRCAWTVVTTDAAALEAALDADDHVISYAEH